MTLALVLPSGITERRLARAAGDVHPGPASQRTATPALVRTR